ncbi:hypothetical protein E4U43_007866 [Claviceps pusilla]|uniref:SET domain-containing protein n=1 Tax=Claviceps pusilla TaxID=123648 RepID=A0A9P7T074_9HYPO|nr:hypothetical protein E4U43_007866 [Claviceps pusilla]
MPGHHSYSFIQLPRDAPFVLRPSPGKGWGAFAKRRIEVGQLIIKESPFFVIRKSPTERTEDILKIAVATLSPIQKLQFSLIRKNSIQVFTSMEEAFDENCFKLGDNADPGLCGLFPLHSRLNHSCVPNATISRVGYNLESFANTCIQSDEEICFSYNGGFEALTMVERHRLLAFVCTCKACRPGTTFQQCSDMRRRLIRGLHFLCQRRRADQHPDAAQIILDPILRQTAAAGEIPLSSRFIYEVLSCLLLEQEGLLNDILQSKAQKGVGHMSTAFRNKDNADIAAAAMAQTSWLERLDIACRLWGRRDPADAQLASINADRRRALAARSSSHA